MPILYIHGVAIREEDKNGWDEVRTFLQGINWESVEGRLRQYIAPVLNPQHPESVVIQEGYWGDLGASPKLPPVRDETLSPAQLTPAALADALEDALRPVTPMQTWPQLIQAVWEAAHDSNLRQSWLNLPAEGQWAALQKATEAHLHQEWAKSHPLQPWPLLAQLRQDIHVHLMQRVKHLRGPLESFLPYFMGDILDYLLKRGTPQEPGPIPARMLGHLKQLQAIKEQTGEPIIVLTHSMGGQIMYDTLSTFAPAQPDLKDLRVDFWGAAASQLGLFASLNLFVQPTTPQGTLSPLPNLSYLWNAWSPTDLLSFQANPYIPEAHDIAMSLTDDAFKAHIEYIISPLFYEIFASKIGVRLGQPS